MERWPLAIEIVATLIGTALVLLHVVVMVGVVLLPVTWAADWWLGNDIEFLSHPRRNALGLGVLVVIAMIALEVRTMQAHRR